MLKDGKNESVPHRYPHARNLRKGRYSQPGMHYFLTSSVANRRSIFTQNQNAIVVLDAICWLHQARRFIVDAAVVMPDHLHLAGQLGGVSLPRLMHAFKSYTGNRLSSLGVDAPVWQQGYHDHALRDEEDYATKIRYLIENPVRAGLVERAEDYPYVIWPTWWSS